MPTYTGAWIDEVVATTDDQGADVVFVKHGGQTIELRYDECNELIEALKFLVPDWVPRER